MKPPPAPLACVCVVCVYYCSTYYKAVREGCVWCVCFITAGPITKLFDCLLCMFLRKAHEPPIYGQ